MKRPLRFALPVVLLLVLGLGAKLWQQRQANTAATASASEAAAAPVALELAATDVLTVGPAELGRTVAVSGGLKAVSSAWVKAKVAGELRSLQPREGDAVKAGQVLGRIDTLESDLRVQQAQKSAEAAQAQVDIARRQLENNRALVEQGFVSPTALDTSIANDNAARANLQAARSAVDLVRKTQADAVLRAPIDGLVSQRLAQPGERVAVDARLLEIVDLSRLELEAAVAPEDAAALRVGQPARLQVEGLGAPVAATVARINPSTQAGSRAVLAYLSVPATPGLRVGLFARGSIELERARALAVPVTAVRLDNPVPQVLVLRADAGGVERVRRVDVQLGRRGLAVAGAAGLLADEEIVELRSGVQAGDRLLRATVGPLADGVLARVNPAAAAASAPAAAAAPASSAR